MGILRSKTVLVALFAIFLQYSAVSVFADGDSLVSGQSSTYGPYNLGIIFNANDLLLGLESYQAGLGAMVGWGSLSFRGLFDFTLNGSSKAYAFNAGVAVEYHLLPGPISPYIGASFGGGYMTQSEATSAVTFTLEALAAVEIFIFDFLSVFAEYSVAADLTDTKDIQTSESTFDYLISTRMGNNAKLGIVVYVMRSQSRKK